MPDKIGATSRAPRAEKIDRRDAKTEAPALPTVSKDNIDEMENETINRVNKTLSALEVAISTWEASKEKSEDLKPKYMRYIWFHDALTQWERDMLINRGKERAYEDRMARLQEFASICNAYAHG